MMLLTSAPVRHGHHHSGGGGEVGGFHSFARSGDGYRVRRHLEAEQFGRGHGKDDPIINND